MTYTDLLNAAGILLSADGWLLAFYMFFVFLIAMVFQLEDRQRQFFWLFIAGLAIGFLGPSYADTIVEARFPYVFIFCFGVLGIGLAVAGFASICFAPSIFAFAQRIDSRRLLLAANIAMVFPLGPVILFVFVLKEYKKSLATLRGDQVQLPAR